MTSDRYTKRAAALQYDPSKDEAPILTAVGKGEVAQKIIEKAEEHGVPVVEDSSTAEVLSHLSVGDAIPPALYEVVASILVFVAEMDSSAKGKLSRFADKY